MSKHHTLDKSQPYAQVYGDTLGRHFEQDGRHFNSEGKLWRDPTKKETPEEIKAREEAEKAEAEAKAVADAAAAASAQKASETDAQVSQQMTIGKVG